MIFFQFETCFYTLKVIHFAVKTMAVGYQNCFEFRFNCQKLEAKVDEEMYPLYKELKLYLSKNGYINPVLIVVIPLFFLPLVFGRRGFRH